MEIAGARMDIFAGPAAHSPFNLRGSLGYRPVDTSNEQ
jgi:hypothetical protein